MLLVTQRAIVAEFDESQIMKAQLSDAIKLDPLNYHLPITMQDQNGNIFSEVYVEWRTPILLSDTPVFIQQLFLKSEDAGFYEHQGYNVSAIIRALLVNAQSDGKSQGGSTITQQLIRMQYLTTDKTYERKVVELLYAAELEKTMTKNEILEAYLNEMYFGNRVYGIESAATYYFNRPLDQLNEAEMAFIAAIPNNPKRYNPLTNFDNTKARQERLLDTMEKEHIITSEESITYKEMPIQLDVKNKANQFPMYSDYVLNELEALIAHEEGFAQKMASQNDDDQKKILQEQLDEKITKLLTAGITIETALDSRKQAEDERALNILLQNNVQAGAAVIDNDAREIISLYGGVNYTPNDFNRAFQAVRQPGSAIKPLLVYAPLFETTAYTGNTYVNSGPICIQSYCPKNIGGYTYGLTTIQEAFRHSHNTTAVRLLQQVGIEEAFSYLEAFKFQAVSSKDMNYPAALGGFQNGMTPLELASAYSSFIDGRYRAPRAIRTVKDRDGNILYEWPSDSITIWSDTTTETIRTLLQDVVLNGTGRGIPITTGYTGIKTGTTDRYHDLWTAGLNNQYTTAVWLGQDTPSSIQFASDQKRHLRAIQLLLKTYE